MSEWSANKVFFSDVSVQKCKDGYHVGLDNKPLKTPAKSHLAVPTKALADGIADEWRSLDDLIIPEKLPLTKMANAAIDTVALQKNAVVNMLAEYGTTDLICYHAVSPDGLVEKQMQAWDPLIDWFHMEYGVRLEIGSGVMPVGQPDATLSICRKILNTYTHFELAAMHDLISLSGSFVIGLAVAKNKLDLLEGWQASRIDEDWQITEWGADDEASDFAKTRHKAFENAAYALKLLK